MSVHTLAGRIKMRNKLTFTFVDAIIATAIIAIVISMIFGFLSYSNMIGKKHTVKGSGVVVEVIAQSENGYDMWICRIDNGPGVTPRYQQIEFRGKELEPVLEK